MTLDRGQRRLGSVGALAIDQLGHGQTLELAGQLTKLAAIDAVPIASPGRGLAPPGRALAPPPPGITPAGEAVATVRRGARDVKRRRSPEDPLDDAAVAAKESLAKNLTWAIRFEISDHEGRLLYRWPEERHEKG